MKLISKLLYSTVLACVTTMAAAVTGPYSALFVFGDSLSDNGNNTLLPVVGTDPLQKVGDNRYVPFQTYASGVYSNGPVWVTPFAASLGLTATPSLLLQAQKKSVANGADFAFGGATTNGAGVPNLTLQANSYLGAVGGVASASALYVVAGGGNNGRGTIQSLAALDPKEPTYGTTFNSILANDAQTYANDVFNIVDNLRKAGAEHIIVWDTPNLGPVPATSFYGPGLSAIGTAVSLAMNQALQATLPSVPNIKIFDVYNLLSLAGANGVTFSNTSDACGALSNVAKCPDISTSLYWDGIHPTTAAHQVIASQMTALALTAPVPEPSEIAMMLAGLLLVAKVSRRKATPLRSEAS